MVRPHQALQPQHGSVLQGAFVGQENRAAADAEQAVGEDHGSVVAGVPVGAEGLRGDQQRQLVPLRLEDVLHNVHGDEAGAATHAGEVVHLHVVAELVAVDDARGERRDGGEHGDVDDQDVDLGGGDFRFRQKLPDGVAEELFHLFDAVAQCGRSLSALEDVSWRVSLFADAGADDGLQQKTVLVGSQVFAAFDEFPTELGVQHSVVGGLVALVVQDVTLSVASLLQHFPYEET